MKLIVQKKKKLASENVPGKMVKNTKENLTLVSHMGLEK